MEKLDYPGRIMALDLGEKRIGVAVSDETRLIASPYGVLKRKSRREDFERYAKIIEEQQIKLLVVGLPIGLDGEEGKQSAWVRDYTAELEQHIDIGIEFWDESLTTKDAQTSLRALGRRGKRLKDQVDAVAAALILQSYLNAARGNADG